MTQAQTCSILKDFNIPPSATDRGIEICLNCKRKHCELDRMREYCTKRIQVIHGKRFKK